MNALRLGFFAVVVVVPLAGCQKQELAQAPATAPSATGAPVQPLHEHVGRGRVVKIDREGKRITIAHDPIPSLSWPAMTMEFAVRDGRFLDNVSTGQTLDFSLEEVTPRVYVITRLAPVA